MIVQRQIILWMMFPCRLALYLNRITKITLTTTPEATLPVKIWWFQSMHQLQHLLFPVDNISTLRKDISHEPPKGTYIKPIVIATRNIVAASAVAAPSVTSLDFFKWSQSHQDEDYSYEMKLVLTSPSPTRLIQRLLLHLMTIVSLYLGSLQGNMRTITMPLPLVSALIVGLNISTQGFLHRKLWLHCIHCSSCSTQNQTEPHRDESQGNNNLDTIYNLTTFCLSS